MNGTNACGLVSRPCSSHGECTSTGCICERGRLLYDCSYWFGDEANIRGPTIFRDFFVPAWAILLVLTAWRLIVVTRAKWTHGARNGRSLLHFMVNDAQSRVLFSLLFHSLLATISAFDEFGVGPFDQKTFTLLILLNTLCVVGAVAFTLRFFVSLVSSLT